MDFCHIKPNPPLTDLSLDPLRSARCPLSSFTYSHCTSSSSSSPLIFVFVCSLSPFIAPHFRREMSPFSYLLSSPLIPRSWCRMPQMHSCIHFSSQMLIADDYWRNGSTHRKTWELSREGRLLVVTVIKYPVSDFLADAEEKRQPCFPRGCCTSRAVQRKSASFFLGCPSHLNISFALHQHDLVSMSSRGNNVLDGAGSPTSVDD